ncbi:probable RNA-binding protein 46 [Panulirus ornatus]|uniref:probable RNA-binding protein 46 n=1 Tax=Panulirus ornatus TaxID=150431 RepID=UPI003A87080D
MSLCSYQKNWNRAEYAARLVWQWKGCLVVRTNGQRVYGPPPGWSNPVPQRGSEVFVVRLPRDLFEDELLPVVERAGTVYQLRLMMTFTGTNRGYAFVTYATPLVAELAVKMLNNYEIRSGSYIGVRLSVDNRRLYLGNIPVSRTKQELLQEMQQVTEGVVKVIMHGRLKDRSKNRGYAFVEYESHRAAAMARRKLFSHLMPWGLRDITVDWAKPMMDEDNSIRLNKCRCFCYCSYGCTCGCSSCWTAGGKTAGCKRKENSEASLWWSLEWNCKRAVWVGGRVPPPPC